MSDSSEPHSAFDWWRCSAPPRESDWASNVNQAPWSKKVQGRRLISERAGPGLMGGGFPQLWLRPRSSPETGCRASGGDECRRSEPE